MKRIIFMLAMSVVAGWSIAQRPVTVECRTGDGVGSTIHIFRVENGQKVAIADAVYNKNGYYGFKFVPEYESFYVVGDTYNFQYPVYLKEGDAFAMYMDKDTVYLEGKKNSPENTVLYQWVALSRKVASKSVRFQRVRSTYKDFFPDFEVFLPAADEFKAGIKTKNARFNELMKRSIDFEKDYYALTFLYTPRTEHPSKEQRPAFYSSLLRADKFTDDKVLEMPYGMELVNRYCMHASLEDNVADGAEDKVSYIRDKRVRGEYALEEAAGMKSYFAFQKFTAKNEKYLNEDQKKRMEAIGSKLYEMRKGQPAVDFTYPDAQGKMVSLSDFKGKVVLVDVWATWCSPCRDQLPYLKKLEEEMQGEDVVFMGVSVDVKKDLEKWKQFITDEQLPGIQLFADGWSKITKDYKITGIPRFMVFDGEGKVVEAMAPRPSSPDLKELLEGELKRLKAGKR